MREFSLLFVAPAKYSGLYQRHQAFAALLAQQGYRVLYLDPLQSPGFGIRFSTPGNNLAVAEIFLPFRAANFPWLHKFAAQLAFSLVKRRLEKKAWLWLAEPSMASFVENDWKMIIYDRCDRHGFFPGQRLQAWNSYENSIFSHADKIVISHPQLAEDIAAKFFNKITLAKNACSEKIGFSARKTGAEKQLQLISSGAHFEWIDCKWLQMIAKNPDVKLHIAGSGRGTEFHALISMPGVTFHGRLDHEKLFALYRESDVGLVPFLTSPLTATVDPIKVYEYAASGMKVWSTPVPSLATHELVDQQISDAHQLQQAIYNYSPLAVPRQVPRWSQRLQTILDRIH